MSVVLVDLEKPIYDKLNLEKSEVNVKRCYYKNLDDKTKEVALEAILSINKETSTQPRLTWERYTDYINSLIEEGENLYIAEVADKIVGYAIFKITGKESANCEFLAVDKDYRRKGIGKMLQEKIFESGFKCFTGHMWTTNKNAELLLNKFKKMGHDINEKPESPHRLFYTVFAKKK